MTTATHSTAELCPLTDSLASSIRWRLRDYEAILRAELEMLAAPARRSARTARIARRRGN